MADCSKCPLEQKCKEWKDTQTKGGVTQEIRASLEEILENYCPISAGACAAALQQSEDEKKE